MPSEQRNILYFSSFGNLRWGGQRSLFYLVTRLDRDRYRPHVILPTDEDLAEELRKCGIVVIIQELPRLLNADILKIGRAFKAIREIVETCHIHLIHTDGPRNTFYAGIPARLKQVPLVWHIRDSDRDPYDRVLVSLSSKIILVADSLRKRFSWNRSKDKFVTVYNGVDLSVTPVHPDRPVHVRRDFSIPEDRLLIACVGRVERRKGLHDLIEACGPLKHRLPLCHLFFAGELSEPDYQRECLEAAGRWGLLDRVTFSGHLDKVQDLLREIDIFVLPSLSGEAFSRAIIEAMAAAKPVIASDVGGAAEAVEESVTGYVVPPGDPPALRERLVLLGEDALLRRRMGEAGRTRVERLFTIDENVKKTEAVYDALFAPR